MDARSAAIIAYHNNGEKSLTAVGAHFGVSHQTVFKVLQRAGITARKHYFRSLQDLSVEQFKLFRKLCNAGVPASVAHVEVRRERDIPVCRDHATPRWHGEELARLKEVYEAGNVRVVDIVEMFDTSLGNLGRLAVMHKWKRRRMCRPTVRPSQHEAA